MPIPAFDAHGVLPPGYHLCTLAEVEDRFAMPGQRQMLWEGLTRFIDWSRGNPIPEAAFINGGFTTDKAHPKDIDVVYDLRRMRDNVIAFWSLQFATQRKRILDDFGVDFWV